MRELVLNLWFFIGKTGSNMLDTGRVGVFFLIPPCRQEMIGQGPANE